jgi:hypothetical protein
MHDKKEEERKNAVNIGHLVPLQGTQAAWAKKMPLILDI